MLPTCTITKLFYLIEYNQSTQQMKVQALPVGSLFQTPSCLFFGISPLADKPIPEVNGCDNQLSTQFSVVSVHQAHTMKI